MITMLADHVWQSTLVALAIGALTLMLRQQAARLRYGLWFCASVKFLVPFAWLLALGRELGKRTLPAVAPISTPGLGLGALVERIAQPVATAASRGPALAQAAPPAQPHLDLAWVLLSFWAAGTVLVLGVWLARWLDLTALVRRSHLWLTELFDDPRLELRVTPGRIEPGVVGILHPVLLLPDGIAARLTPAQLGTVLEHELCHVRRRDNLTAAVHMLVEALFWFHPLVWWIGGRLVEERERACDEAVLAATDDPRNYAAALIAVCEACVRSPLPCVAGIGGAGALRERIARLLSAPRVRPLGVVKRAVLTAAAFVLLGAPLAIGVLTAPAVRAQAAVGSASASTLPDGDPPGLTFMGPRLTAVDTPLRDLIAFAFHVPKAQVVGPGGLDAHYTIVAELPVVDYSEVPPSEQYRAYLRPLLEQRFGLGFHRETVVVPALSLVSGAWNPGLTPASGNGPLWLAHGSRPCAQPGCPPVPSPLNSIGAQGVPINMLTEFLTAVLGMPILDRTGLTGSYDFTLEWPVETERADRNGLPSNEVLARVLEEQVGLKLLPVDAPVERVVVDRIAAPKDAAPAPADVGADPPAVILRAPARASGNTPVLKFTIDRHGAMFFGPGGDAAVSLDADTVLAIASAAVGRDPTVPAFIDVDGPVANHRVMEVANLLARAGVTQIGFATLPFRPNTMPDQSSKPN
jgi:bla regulator protein blaR1